VGTGRDAAIALGRVGSCSSALEVEHTEDTEAGRAEAERAEAERAEAERAEAERAEAGFASCVSGI